MQQLETPLNITLRTHLESLKKIKLKKLFESDPQRFDKFSYQIDECLIDLSKHFLDDYGLKALTEFSVAKQLAHKIQALFKGETVNVSEGRAALHVALRDVKHKYTYPKKIYDDIQHELKRIKEFADTFKLGKITGVMGDAITDIVHVAIGGSDLGPRLLYQVLQSSKNLAKVHFTSGIDGVTLEELLKKLDPKRTLVCIVSKSFTTKETMHQAEIIKKWIFKYLPQEARDKHLIGISANEQAMAAFGIDKTRQFYIWDFVGGRFSVWSAVSLSVILACGFEHFEELLHGAAIVDEHFYTEQTHKNVPILMAFLNFCYSQFFTAFSQMIAPYHEKLLFLPQFLQQMFMESLGKQTDLQGNPIYYPTGQIIWGGLGPNGQHAYYQLLHQGWHFIPVDFIVPVQLNGQCDETSILNYTNAFSQSLALMQGHQDEKNKAKSHPGNRPSTTIVFQQLNAKILGILLALYEHAVFTQSVFLNINSFDQYGVELGKQISSRLVLNTSRNESSELDSSTLGLLDFAKM